MSTKAQIKASIDTKLADASDILASELREVENVFLDEHFPTTTNYVLASGNIQYDLNFKKVGNTCIVQGFVKNNTASILNSNTTMFAIPNSLFYSKYDVKFLGYRDGGSGTIYGLILKSYLNGSPNRISLLAPIQPNSKIEFSLTYTVND